jgi:2-polyprenyl-6-methoxyphenol hydroxylase-like FAD-dependent oxidoreductase
MTVLISGAGIGGLSLALSLHQIGVPVQVFESVQALQPLGVGINLQPHAVRELFELGLANELAAIGVRTAEVSYFSKHGKLIWSEPRGLAAGYNWPQFSVHRGKLQMLLYQAVLERLGREAVHTGTTVGTWNETQNKLILQLVDTASEEPCGTAEGALFIAADGIHSTSRAQLYPHEGRPRWGGTVMWRGVTSAPSFLTGRTMAMSGIKTKKFVCYPITDSSNGQALINWIADLSFPADYLWNREDWNRRGKLEDFLQEFADWHFDWLDIPDLIRNAENVFEYPMVDRDPLPQWTHGRMTLLGDAAHPMYPIGSNGASQAVLDARILTREIAEKGMVPEALEAYEADRRSATSKIVLANRADGPDKVLDVVEERAPEGFATIEDILSHKELEQTAQAYKQLAGFDVESLNARPSIVRNGYPCIEDGA